MFRFFPPSLSPFYCFHSHQCIRYHNCLLVNYHVNEYQSKAEINMHSKICPIPEGAISHSCMTDLTARMKTFAKFVKLGFTIMRKCRTLCSGMLQIHPPTDQFK